VYASDGDANNRATIEAENAQARYYRHELNFWRHPIVPALATLVTALVAATVALRTHYQNKIEARLFETIKQPLGISVVGRKGGKFGTGH
jgi:hypothetical protein